MVVEAQEEARSLRHGYIGTEHLLLGIIRQEDCPGARILAERGIDLERARTSLRAIVPAGEDETPGQIPFTPRAKKSLELALRECISHGNERVEPEHLLLGLLREGEGVAAQIVTELGEDGDGLRDEIVDALPPPGEGRTARRPLEQLRARAVTRTLGPAADPGFEITYSPDVRRLLMRAAARALDDGRTEISVADVEAALHDAPPEAAAG